MNPHLSSTLFEQRAQQIFEDIRADHPEEHRYIEQFLKKNPVFHKILPSLLLTFDCLVQGFTAGHTLFLCGNGGSFADCMHIAGELMKSFKQKRPLAISSRSQFSGLEFGEFLSEHLEDGLPSVVLGLNHSLFSALQNDKPVDAIQFAQELYVLGKPDDILFGISTSGNAQNVLYAVSLAKARGLKTIGLTGKSGGKLAHAVDIAIKAPATATEAIQELHITIYHTLCAMLEARFFIATRP